MDTLIFTEMIAILSCVIFAGAAIYINFAEHPARLECGSRLAATVFGPSYRRAAVMQASLAIIASITGVICGIYLNNSNWFIGAFFIFLVVPFTFTVIMPTNKLLLHKTQQLSEKEIAVLLERWGRLHAVRSLSSLIASIIYVYLGVTS